ncbi:MAG: hypothetical protein A3H27_04395 [Acidobacteria bacterium RIFCSPLOWO2_02_FULL_59_13]|nr:MAG: hypothetical protein A3H27_04395 [Acidobacteria bacterium RIFCSPLOWO2_02_FULL_59_13]
MPKAAFVLAEYIFQCPVEKRWLKPEHRTARFDKIGGWVLFLARLTKREQGIGRRDFLAKFFLRQAAKLTRKLKALPPKEVIAT